MATTSISRTQNEIKGRFQVKNPVTKKWVKVDSKSGRVLETKKTPGPYKGIPKK